MAFKLSIDEVKQKPEGFLYVFASDDFCRAIGTNAGRIIVGKRANQRKILLQSAENAGVDVKVYTDAIRDGFVDIYGITPAEALVKLAQGQEVAGKNWAEGVYGVGALYNTQFTQTPTITVDTQTGKIMNNGVEAAGQTAIIGNGYPNNVQGYSYTDETTGATYSTRYRKVKKAYYAHIYADKDGNKFLSSGVQTSSADGSLWENAYTLIDKLLNWILSLFGIQTNVDVISEKNTLPSQSDGFVTQEAGVSPILVAGMVALAAGTLLNKKGKKK